MAGGPTADLIAEELEAERAWWRSLEHRALSLFASAGIIGGLAGVATHGSALTSSTRILLALALTALALGALAGLAVAFPAPVPIVPMDEISERITPDRWQAGADEHQRRAAELRVEMVERTRRVNRRKARVLLVGIVLAGAGVAFLLLASVAVLAGKG